MALRTTTLAAVRAARPPAAPAQLTIEEARRQYAVGSLELVVAELKEAERIEAIAKEHANALNRQGTKVKNAMRSYALATDMQPADELRIGDTGYRYDVTQSEKIDVTGLYKMLKDKKITEDEFLRSVSVNKSDAEKAIGPHKLLSVSKIVPGKTLDIRKRSLDAAVQEPTVVKVDHVVKPKLNMSQQEAPVKRTATSKPALKPARTIKLRR